MTRSPRLIVLALMVMPSMALAADRADVGVGARTHVYSQVRVMHRGPYPLSRRAADIRGADRCWRTCLAEIGREFQACLRGQRLGDCVFWNAAADRYCLRTCRRGGGPLVTLAE